MMSGDEFYDDDVTSGLTVSRQAENSRLDLIKLAIASAITDRLEGSFDAELARWEREAGVEQMGTGAIEAHFLTEIAVRMIKEVTESEIAERVAEYVA